MKRIVMLAAACVIAVPAFAQNVATVNGKAIPQKSLDQFVKLLVSQGATDSPQPVSYTHLTLPTTPYV